MIRICVVIELHLNILYIIRVEYIISNPKIIEDNRKTNTHYQLNECAMRHLTSVLVPGANL